MFEITNHIKGGSPFNPSKVASGFKMTFANGNTISVQFGYGNYCENRNESRESCKDAEIAISSNDGRWFSFEGDEVKGYCNTDEVAKWLQFAATSVF